MDKIATVLIMGKQDLFGLSARFHGVCLAGIAEQGVFFFWFFLSIYRNFFVIPERSGKEKREAKRRGSLSCMCAVWGA